MVTFGRRPWQDKEAKSRIINFLSGQGLLVRSVHIKLVLKAEFFFAPKNKLTIDYSSLIGYLNSVGKSDSLTS